MSRIAVCVFLLASFAAHLSAQKAEDFAGEWMSNFGPLRLDAKGLKLSGTSGWDEGTKMSGTVEKGVAVLEWKSADASGEVRFEKWSELELLSGAYTSAAGKPGEWSAYRKQPAKPEPKAGEVVEGQTLAGMRSYLRVPKKYQAAKHKDAILIFHGSNMSARAYVDTLVAAFPDLADQFVIVGLDGEQIVAPKKDQNFVFNYTYVNFSGPASGPLWAQKQSPSLVAAAIEEMGKDLGIERWFVGGHSQGGFLTYAVTMFYPELVSGAFPVSGNLLMQCEPDAFSDAKVCAKQRAVPIAIVHGENDGIVEFSAATYALDRFEDSGFPALRLFSDPQAAHMFARLPIEAAVKWLAAESSSDPQILANFAKSELSDDQPRSAAAAAQRAITLKAKGGALTTAQNVLKQLEKDAAPEVKRLKKLMQANADGAWVPDFLKFRARYALLAGAEPVLDRYASLRADQAKRGDELFYRSRNEKDEAARKALREELVRTCYATKWYALVSSWLH